MKIMIELSNASEIPELQRLLATMQPSPPAREIALLVSELGLPGRVVNALKAMNVTDVSQLLKISDDELIRAPNLGKRSVEEIRAALKVRHD